MKFLTKTLFLTVTLASLAGAIIPLVDRTTGIIQQRPYCPGRPASPEFQRAALYEFISEFFFERDGISSSFLNFNDEDYIQHSSGLPPYGRNNTLSQLLKFGGSNGFNATILQIMFDSPYGMVHYRLDVPGQQPTAVMDLWRFEGTCMKEHWDVLQSLPVNATNPIALF
jgi:predicted SnoaL-like aldol condensation-catalyzing enzyme